MKKGYSTPEPLIVTPPPDYVRGAWFDQDAVDRVVNFFKLLKHVTGRWRGQALVPVEWQIEYLLAPVFGWKHKNGTRIIREVWAEFPRKNGKSTISSGLGLYLFAADREPAAQVYAAAGDKDQARIVFDPSKNMVEMSPTLRRKIRVYRNYMEFPATGSIFRVLSSDARLKHGLNVSGAVIDEIHVHKNRDLIDAIESGTGSREQPLIIFITTAGEEDFSVYAEKREHVEKQAKGHIKDPTNYGVIFAAGEKDNPFTVATQKKANPGYGVTVKPDYLKAKAERAQNTPGWLNTYKRLHLGVRTKVETGWLNLRKWDESAGIVDETELAGRECYAALDLASSVDLTALAMVFENEDGSFDVVARFWIPEEGLTERSKLEDVPYDRWVREGHIFATDGNIIDHRAIKDYIGKMASRFHILELGYDPWHATQLAVELEEEGMTVVPMRQGFRTLSEPTKLLERLVLASKLHHGGNPVLRWNADCTTVKYDDNDNVRPVKPDRRKSAKRIDGIVAAIMALGRASLDEGATAAFLH